MKIRLRTQYAGPRGTYAAGAVVDFDQAEAHALIQGGFGDEVAVQGPLKSEPVETAAETTEAPAAPERTVGQGQRPRKR